MQRPDRLTGERYQGASPAARWPPATQPGSKRSGSIVRPWQPCSGSIGNRSPPYGHKRPQDRATARARQLRPCPSLACLAGAYRPLPGSKPGRSMAYPWRQCQRPGGFTGNATREQARPVYDLPLAAMPAPRSVYRRTLPGSKPGHSIARPWQPCSAPISNRSPPYGRKYP